MSKYKQTEIPTKECITCGKTYHKVPANSQSYWDRKKYCSLVCFGNRIGHKGYWLGKKRTDMVGEKHWNWDGGRTQIVERVRKCFEYRQWRSDVFTRDDFTCQECGQRGGRLHADHIKQFAFIIAENKVTTLEQAIECSELWNLNNGRTLCKPCHRQIPVFTYGGTRKITFVDGEPTIID